MQKWFNNNKPMKENWRVLVFLRKDESKLVKRFSRVKNTL